MVEIIEIGNARLYLGDMFAPGVFDSLASDSIDAIITDFPYGTLNKRNEWDQTIDFSKFWEFAAIVGTSTMPVVSTAQQPFTSKLVSTNYKAFKYTMVWEKSKATGYLNSKKQPLRAHEDIVVFYNRQCTFNPQMTQGSPYDKGTAVRDTEAYGLQTKAVHVKNQTGLRYPRSVQYFVTAESEGKLHPTQKPLALFDWLIRTYTNEGDVVLDPCMGSGTTGVAAVLAGRKFVGFERDPAYFGRAVTRFRELIL